ncbi:MAG: homocysteine S-methyltransferase family protein, partial [Planctomycetales bacterium]|nr:homocysteine S-methyltransferase family protein [Planctomycetales bacterium]
MESRRGGSDVVRNAWTGVTQALFIDALSADALILLDGANGTEIERRIGPLAAPLWTAAALVEAPDVIQQVHRDYVRSGARILTANTFRTHARNLKHTPLAGESDRLTKLAVSLAREAANGHAWVAGSLAPMKDCYRSDLFPELSEFDKEHREQAARLATAGVDLILAETHGNQREALAACRAGIDTGLPTVVSLLCRDANHLWSGESLADTVVRLAPLQPAAIGVNCVAAYQVSKVLQSIHTAAPDIRLIAYGNTSEVDAQGKWHPTDAVAPDRYADHVAGWLAIGCHLVGGCCGTTPEHIAKLNQRFHFNDQE